MNANGKTKKGFTLIEVIVAIGLLGILSAIAIPSFSGLQKSMKQKTLQSQAELGENALLTAYSQTQNQVAAIDLASSSFSPTAQNETVKFGTIGPNKYQVTVQNGAQSASVTGSFNTIRTNTMGYDLSPELISALVSALNRDTTIYDSFLGTEKNVGHNKYIDSEAFYIRADGSGKTFNGIISSYLTKVPYGIWQIKSYRKETSKNELEITFTWTDSQDAKTLGTKIDQWVSVIQYATKLKKIDNQLWEVDNNFTPYYQVGTIQLDSKIEKSISLDKYPIIKQNQSITGYKLNSDGTPTQTSAAKFDASNYQDVQNTYIKLVESPLPNKPAGQ